MKDEGVEKYLGSKERIVEEPRHDTKPSSTNCSEDVPTKNVISGAKRLGRERGADCANESYEELMDMRIIL